MHTIVNHGYVAPRIDDTQYVLGGGYVPKILLQPSANWLNYLPEKEEQFKNGLETYACTVFATNNCIEILNKRQCSLEENNSDRWVYIKAGITPPGADPHHTAEAARKYGQVPESLLPFDSDIDSMEEFTSLEGLDSTLEAEASKWKQNHTFLHEWVFTSGTLHEKQNKLKEMLQYSPLGVSVLAWKERNGLYFKDVGEPDSHWTCLVGYVEGKYWIVFDSYPDAVGEELKKLEWDYDFGCAKRYYLDIREKVPFWKRLLAFLKRQ